MKELPLLYTGGKNTGKSCAMAALYGALDNGLSLKAGGKQARLSQEHDLTTLLEGDARRLCQEGRLPPARPQAALYRSTLCLEGKPLCRLSLLDYPGSLLMEEDLLTRKIPEGVFGWAVNPADSDPDDPYGELDDFFDGDEGPGASGEGDFLFLLANAPVLVYLIPGDLLALDRQMEWMEAHQKTQALEYRLAAARVAEPVRVLRSLMHRVQEIRQDRPPLLLYVTKADLLQTGVTVSWAAQRLIQRHNLFFPDTEVLACGSSLVPGTQLDCSQPLAQLVQGFRLQGFSLPLLLALGRYLSEDSAREGLELFRQLEKEQLVQDPYRRMLFHLSLAALGTQDLHRQFYINRLRQKTDGWAAASAIARYLEEAKPDILYFDRERKMRPLREFFSLRSPAS